MILRILCSNFLLKLGLSQSESYALGILYDTCEAIFHGELILLNFILDDLKAVRLYRAHVGGA